MGEKIDIINREAGEHIDNMQLGLHADDANQVCAKLHGDVARAMIWAIRKIEELFHTTIFVKSHITAKFWGIELPLERGLSFRDLIILLILGYVIYVHFKYGIIFGK